MFRIGVLGDLICTLPMCAEIRRRHPHPLLLYVTMRDYKTMVQLAREPDGVYGARSWKFVPTWSVFGLVEKVYAPETTDERTKSAGPTCHLVDDLANSCGISPDDRQPHLYPPAALIERVRTGHGLQNRRLIAINGGRTWPVREWGFDRWQALVNLIHAEFDVTILLFGVGEAIPLHGVESFVNHRVLADEMAAIIAACDLVISIDSGPVHLAGAVGTPVVGLFGAVDPRLRLPPGSRAMAVEADVPCLHCHHRTPRGHWQTGCPNDIRCMKELAVNAVFEAVKENLSLSYNSNSAGQRS
ncbi:MAG TPA: glycosyltransferase family 9 protein [Verrucomicrobiae bacterium]